MIERERVRERERKRERENKKERERVGGGEKRVFVKFYPVSFFKPQVDQKVVKFRNLISRFLFFLFFFCHPS